MADHYHYVGVLLEKWPSQPDFMFRFVCGIRHSLDDLKRHLEEDAEHPLEWKSGFWDGQTTSEPWLDPDENYQDKYVIQRTYSHDCTM